MRVRRLAALAPIALAALLAGYVTSSPAGSDSRAAPIKTVATAATSDFRVVVTATKTGSGSAPTARAALTTSARTGTGWRRTDTHAVAGTYFWKTLTGPRAVCRLELRTAGGATSAPHAVVQLLQTPSLGCGAASEHPLGR